MLLASGAGWSSFPEAAMGSFQLQRTRNKRIYSGCPSFGTANPAVDVVAWGSAPEEILTIEGAAIRI